MSDDHDEVVVPLRSNLSDQQIEELLYDRIERASESVKALVEEVNREISDVEEGGKDSIHAFGKLIQYVKALPVPEMQTLLAGALWELSD